MIILIIILHWISQTVNTFEAQRSDNLQTTIVGMGSRYTTFVGDYVNDDYDNASNDTLSTLDITTEIMMPRIFKQYFMCSTKPLMGNYCSLPDAYTTRVYGAR